MHLLPTSIAPRTFSSGRALVSVLALWLLCYWICSDALRAEARLPGSPTNPEQTMARLDTPALATEAKPVSRRTLFTWNSTAEIQGGPPGLDEPLASDRPDFTEASSTVGRERVQLEVGYTYLHDASAGESVSVHSFPEMLWRIGAFAEWLEFRIAYNHGAEIARATGQDDQLLRGSRDLYLGMKLGLTPQQGWLPEMSLVPQMTIPTGDDEFTADRTLPGLNWLYGWDINETFSFAGSTQWNQALDGTEEYSSFAQSLTIGYTLSEKWGAYTEWFTIMPHQAVEVLPQHYFDGGFIYRFTNNLQYDIRAGVGLNESAADYFVGTGLVKRW